MATITWYVTNNLASGSAFQEMSETSPGAEATSSPNFGWTVSSVAAGNYSEGDAQAERASSTFATSPIHPDTTFNYALGPGYRSVNTYNGSFASANWTISCVVIAVTSGGDQDGRIGIRLWRDTNADGSTATEITSARQVGSAVTNLGTGTSQTSTVTFNPGVFSLTNEYLFVDIAWEITGAGGKTTRDVIHRIGTTGTRVLTADFTAAVTADPFPFVGGGYFPTEG